ncbi:Gluconate 2-dehydrogenase, membrane-bound, cytochrome c [Acetobacter malorum]|uniref:Gluconate 2-dehydrogenase, membrane-bound, cytochrome c n=1 Tax=Acetobacter malorum TaxID=178901 RepID=A0A177G8H3_9PROT|nr:Gluconate 2-dehydrogenase, membrane-bound, cytochrome c [Acetobacter malorum]
MADLTTFLRTGRNMRSSAFGNMDTAVHHGTQYLTDDDLTAMARYLKALPAANSTEQSWQKDPAATRALRAGGTLTAGQRLYLDNCAACHRSTGAGYAPAFPPLAGNPVVMNAAPDSLIHIVLTGATLHGTQDAPSSFTMPGFGKRLSDAQVAAVVTFIRHAWGNDASAVSDVDVAHLRKRLTPSTMQSAPPTPVDPAPAQPGAAPKAAGAGCPGTTRRGPQSPGAGCHAGHIRRRITQRRTACYEGTLGFRVATMQKQWQNSRFNRSAPGAVFAEERSGTS